MNDPLTNAQGFKEILLIDADNSVAADPSYLFECEEYTRQGSLFWCDMYSKSTAFVRMYDPWNTRPQPNQAEATLQDLVDRWLVQPVRTKPDFGSALKSIGLSRNSLTMESGQVLMHATRCVAGLAAAVLLNQNVHRRAVYAGDARVGGARGHIYTLNWGHGHIIDHVGLHGDKDTFRVAWAASAIPYTFASDPADAPELGGELEAASGVFRDSCFVQVLSGPASIASALI